MSYQIITSFHNEESKRNVGLPNEQCSRLVIVIGLDTHGTTVQCSAQLSDALVTASRALL